MSVEGKLYLGSIGVPTPERGDLCAAYVEVVEDSLDGRALAIIPNGKDDFSKIEREKFIEGQKQQLGEVITAPIVVLDLREFEEEKNKDSLKRKLDEIGSLWLTGGNSYWLRHLMGVSGLAHELPDRLSEDSLTLGGYSAGPIALGRSLDLSLKASDNPDFDVVFNNPKLKGKATSEGLGITPFTFLPHIGNDYFPDLTKAAEALLTPEMPTFADVQATALQDREGKLPLLDSQALIATYGKYTIVQETV